MPAKTFTTTPHGISARMIEVEAEVSMGLPDFRIVGLPDAAVRESKERIRHAIRNTGRAFPDTKVTVNLAPANVRKTGGQMDLAIAIAILVSVRKQQSSVLPLLLGELSLTGSLRGGNGTLASLLRAKDLGIREVIVPSENAQEAALVPGMSIYVANHLGEVLEHLEGTGALKRAQYETSTQEEPNGTAWDLMKGQNHAKRALEIAAAGGHNVLLVGPPGSGKTSLARACADILPPLCWEESLEVAQIQSATGELASYVSLPNMRPFRNPHHTASITALVGGGVPLVPGEVTRAHRGVLFLDELPEFPRRVLETLRQPLEQGEICIVRARERITFPARCMLIAAMNPCPCGHGGEVGEQCTCMPSKKDAYQRILSGPIADRIDMMVHMPRISADEYLSQPPSVDTSSEKGQGAKQVQKRVLEARLIQQNREKSTGATCNAELGEEQRKKKGVLHLSITEQQLMRRIADTLHLSARGMNRILKVARTIADLEGEEVIQSRHISEAFQFRRIDDIGLK